MKFDCHDASFDGIFVEDRYIHRFVLRDGSSVFGKESHSFWEYSSVLLPFAGMELCIRNEEF